MIELICTNNKKMPKWAAKSFVTDDNRVFVPAALARDGEPIVLFSCCYDAEPIIKDGKHIYVNIDWLIRNFPEDAVVFEQIKKKNLEAART
jgi:hypothetical protein